MFTHTIEDHWEEIRDEIQDHWEELTETELKKVKGRRDKMVALLRAKYGYNKKKAERELDEFLIELEEQKEKAQDKAGAFRETLGARATALRESAEERVKDLRDTAEGKVRDIRESVEQVPVNVNETVRSYPWTAMGIMLVIGFVIGVWLGSER